MDIDVDIPAAQEKWQIHILRERAMHAWASVKRIRQSIAATLGSEVASYLHQPDQRYAKPIRLRVDEAERSTCKGILGLTLTAGSGQPIPLGELVTISKGESEHPIVHKNLQPIVMVTADVAIKLDNPLYGMAEISSLLKQEHPSGRNS